MALVRFKDFNTNNQATYDAAIKEGMKYSTGKAIMEYLADSNRPFDVVVIKNGSTYGQMLTHQDKSSPDVITARQAYKEAFGGAQDNSSTMQIVRPTVFWCPDYKFEYYGDVVGCTQDSYGVMKPKKTLAELKSGEYYYRFYVANILKPGEKTATEIPVVRYTKGFMEPWIVLYHELGHVKQYWEGGAANEAETKWVEKLKDTDAIEADNLKRHENPVCTDIHIAIRLHYKHMALGMGDINQAFMSKARAPGLRVANNPGERATMDATLDRDAKANKLQNLTKEFSGYFVV